MKSISCGATNKEILNDIKIGYNYSESKLGYLNKFIQHKNKERVLEHVKLVNQIKAMNPYLDENVHYELYLTKESLRVKLAIKLQDIQKKLDMVRNKIGDYDIVQLNYLGKGKAKPRPECERAAEESFLV